MPTTKNAVLAPVRQALEAAWREYNQGVSESDMAQVLLFYEKWTAPDFEERDNPKGHVMDRAQMLALMAEAVAMGSPGDSMIVLEATTSIAGLATEGSQAIAVMAKKYCFSKGTRTDGTVPKMWSTRSRPWAAGGRRG